MGFLEPYSSSAFGCTLFCNMQQLPRSNLIFYDFVEFLVGLELVFLRLSCGNSGFRRLPLVSHIVTPSLFRRRPSTTLALDCILTGIVNPTGMYPAL